MVRGAVSLHPLNYPPMDAKLLQDVQKYRMKLRSLPRLGTESAVPIEPGEEPAMALDPLVCRDDMGLNILEPGAHTGGMLPANRGSRRVSERAPAGAGYNRIQLLASRT